MDGKGVRKMGEQEVAEERRMKTVGKGALSCLFQSGEDIIQGLQYSPGSTVAWATRYSGEEDSRKVYCLTF